MRREIRARRQQLLAAFLVGFIFAVFAGTRAASAQEAVAPPPKLKAGTNTVGYDISWPQCDGPYPAGAVGFAVIGLTGGKPYTRNRCFASQYQWAKSVETNPDVYINLDYPKATNWNTFVGPAGICMTADPACTAYNWGYNAARDAVGAGRALGVEPAVWWLDVETENHWSDNPALNARVVAGALDYLAKEALETGIYSTGYQWRFITGGFKPGVRSWLAGAKNLAAAQTMCNSAGFTGGPVTMVQWVEKFDRNLICP